MQYDTLHDLLANSSSSRKYFLSLAPSIQHTLHLHNDTIHSAAELHARVNEIGRYEHHIQVSEALFRE